MSTEAIIGLIVSSLVLGTVYPLLGALWYMLANKVDKLEQASIGRNEFKANMRRLDESNIRVERALGLLPRDRQNSTHDSDAP